MFIYDMVEIGCECERDTERLKLTKDCYTDTIYSKPSFRHVATWPPRVVPKAAFDLNARFS